jgi:copper chaperone CopZ
MFRLRSIPFVLAVAVAQVAHGQPSAPPGVLKVQIVCNDMCCDGCAQTIAAQLYAAPGVTKVESDVPNKLVTITAKASPKLTLERLWTAAEQGKGGPSKLVGPAATYTFTKAESLKPEQRWPAGKHFVVIRALADKEKAQLIADQIHTIRGVESIQIDMQQRALFINTASDVTLSPWAVLAAVEKASADPHVVGGSYGVFVVERPAETTRAAATQGAQTQSQGTVR